MVAQMHLVDRADINGKYASNGWYDFWNRGWNCINRIVYSAFLSLGRRPGSAKDTFWTVHSAAHLLDEPGPFSRQKNIKYMGQAHLLKKKLW